jgi:hypothetical protein
MKQFRNVLSGSTVVVIGNGISLDNTPLEELSRKYVTFGCNHIYKKFVPTYYSFADKQMIDFLPLPETFTPTAMFCRAEACIPGNNPIYPIVASGFSKDINNFVVFGGSGVYVLLQIALYMGVGTVLLVGCDHYYPVAGEKDPGKMFMAGKDDPDHFTCDGGYYKEGGWYCRPSLDAVTEYFKVAKVVYDEAGSKIINCTPGSHLDVFEKQDIDKWLID